MNKFEFTCQYCNYSWGSNYIPQTDIYCPTCTDANIKIKNLTVEKVDYYYGCPLFEDDNKWNP